MSSAVNGLIDLLFHPFCHQQAGMLLQIDGCILPVCDRCAGMYIGVGVVMLMSLFGRLRQAATYPKLIGNVILLTLACTMLLEWVTVRAGLLTPDPDRRFVTGLLFGISAGIYFQIFWNRSRMSASKSPGISILELSLVAMVGLTLGVLARWAAGAALTGAILIASFIWFWLRVNMLAALQINRRLADRALHWTLVGSSLLIVEVTIVLILK